LPIDHVAGFPYFSVMLTYLTAGESHGPQLTVIVDGLPAGLAVDISGIDFQLARRQKGYGRGPRMDIEQDTVNVLSGVRGGRTMGGPITLVIENKDRAGWSSIMRPHEAGADGPDPEQPHPSYAISRPRPGHADLAGGIKYDHHDLRNVLERASARETAAEVAAGSLARQLLEHFHVRFASHVVQIGDVRLEVRHVVGDPEEIIGASEESEVRCIDSKAGEKMIAAIQAAEARHDSLGGVAELIVHGLPAGLGGMSQPSHRLDGRLAAAMMSIPSVKGVEIGLGFQSAGRSGSSVHDEISYDPRGDPAKKRFRRETNNAGGLEGGMTNGEDIVIRVACKPISTLVKPLKTVDVNSKEPGEAAVERADVCVVPAVAVISEAAAALVLADAFLRKFGSDNLREIERNYRGFLDEPY
jgi:chorismate synthase